jgi:hypothetical protein
MPVLFLWRPRIINTFLLSVFIASPVLSQHVLRIAEVQSERQQAIEVPVYFTSDSAVTLVQFIIEYNSAQLQALSPVVELGSQAGGLAISLTSANLPFPPTNPGADANVLIQLSGGGTQTITGDSLELVKLKFFTNGQYGDTLKIWFDPTNGRAIFTTPGLNDIQDENLQLTSGAIIINSPPSAIGDLESDQLPTSFALLPNYPNPFNPSTVISFQLPVNSHVRINVFNLLGQLVKMLVDETRQPGIYELTWDAINDAGGRMPSGEYIVRMQAGEFVQIRKILLLR